MNSWNLSWLPLPLWWPTAAFVSAALVLAAVFWLWRRAQAQAGSAAPRQIALGFALFACLWGLFAGALALWPLQGLDEFSQWARASSYVTIPLWIGGIAWIAALLVARLLAAVGRRV